jgi:hypothetical protein
VGSIFVDLDAVPDLDIPLLPGDAVLVPERGIFQGSERIYRRT